MNTGEDTGIDAGNGMGANTFADSDGDIVVVIFVVEIDGAWEQAETANTIIRINENTIKPKNRLVTIAFLSKPSHVLAEDKVT